MTFINGHFFIVFIYEILNTKFDKYVIHYYFVFIYSY